MSTLSRPEVPLTDGVVALRAFTLDDVPGITNACQDPEISRWTVSIPWPYEEEHARGWISTHEVLWEHGKAAEFAVTAPEDDHLLGSLGFHTFDWELRTVSVGYWVVASERSRGVATRALRLGVSWSFETLGLLTVGLVTMVGNTASERVAAKVGFRMVEEIRSYEHPLAPDRRHHVRRWELRESARDGPR
jgi:RimJ/RimL family protein N-acetyltransferase